MTVDPADLPPSKLPQRLVALVRAPQAEWERIAAEPDAGAGQLYLSVALPLALLSATAGFIGAAVFARRALALAGVDAALHVIVALLTVFAAALAINVFAPMFGSQRNSARAHKLAVYSSAAALAAGVFAALPAIAWLGVIGVYSFGLLFMGLPRLMGTPDLKRLPFMAMIVLIAAVALVTFNALAHDVRAAAEASPLFAPPPAASEAAVRPTARVNVEALERHAQFRGAPNPERLEGFLPPSLPGGYRRQTASVAALPHGAEGRATYTNGAGQIVVTITQLAGPGAVTAFVEANGVQPTMRTDARTVRTETLHGRVISEEAEAESVRYLIIGAGLAIMAQGSGGATIDEARAALETLGIERLEAELR